MKLTKSLEEIWKRWDGHNEPTCYDQEIVIQWMSEVPISNVMTYRDSLLHTDGTKAWQPIQEELDDPDKECIHPLFTMGIDMWCIKSEMDLYIEEYESMLKITENNRDEKQ